MKVSLSFTNTLSRFTLLAALGLLLTACGDPQGAPGQMPPALVTTQPIVTQAVTYQVDIPARVKAPKDAQVSAQVAGILLEIRYKEGEFVEQGQTLFLIDPEPYELALESATAELASAQSVFIQAESDWHRIQGLFKKNAVSDREHDLARSTYESSKARLAQAKSGQRNAQRNLRYTKVEAPISGFTGKADVSEGNLIQVGESLTYLVQTDPLYVEFAMAEKDLSRYRTSLSQKQAVETANLTLGSGFTFTQAGIIDFIDNRVDPQTSRTNMRATFANPDHILTPGEFVKINVALQQFEQAIVVHPSVVSQGPQGPQVYLANNDTAEARPVELGPLMGNQQIILSGLTQGEQLIINGHASVRNGAPIQITNP